MAQGATNFEPEVPSVRINKTWRDSTISTMTMNERQIGLAHIPCLLNDFFKYVGLHYFGGVITRGGSILITLIMPFFRSPFSQPQLRTRARGCVVLGRAASCSGRPHACC